MKKLCSFTLMLFLLTSCGGRVPSPQRAQHIIQRYFHKYGKRYKDSDFGKHRVSKVEISSITELQKNHADIEAFTILDGEGGVYKIRAIVAKKTFGWKFVSWESLANK